MQCEPVGAAMRVLCVDADPYLADLLRYGLGRSGFIVAVAHSGAEALRNAGAGPPDVVVLDADLLDADAAALCRGFHELRARVILLTGTVPEAGMATGHTQGADECMVKPFSLHDLNRSIRALARRTRCVPGP